MLKHNKNQLINCVVTILNILLAIHSPLFAYAFILLYFLFLSKYIPNFFRVSNAFILIFSMALIAASRAYFETESDDFIRYYDIYYGLLHGNYALLFTFGNGFEIGLPCFYLILGAFTQVENPVFVLFCETFFILIFYYIWIEKKVIPYLDHSQITILLVSALFFFSITLATQLPRQMLSMVFLLYALSSTLKKNRLLFLILATLTHLSALPIYLMIKFVRYKPKTAFVCILGGSIIFLYYSSIIINTINLYSPDIINRLNYYLVQLDTTKQSSSLMKMNIRALSSLVLIFLGSFLIRSTTIVNQYKNTLLLFIVLYVILISFPLASFRLTLIFHSILLGLFMFFIFSKYNDFYRLFLLFYILYRILNWSLRIDIENNFRLWESYFWIGYPFHFLLK